MHHKYHFSFLIILLLSVIDCQAARIAGFVKDAQTQEVLIGANVWCDVAQTGTTTDNRGYFTLKMPTASTIEISYVGYATQQIALSTDADTLLHINLGLATELNEVEVTATRVSRFDVVSLNKTQLEQLPTLGGKPDVIKSLQLMAGVQGAQEGSSLMMVRGGDPGQNQYLIDNVPLIYVNHLGGFMSVFNPDMINSIDLYKGNFPARYGGKLSGIVDLTQREGDVSAHKGSFSMGLTDASFTFEGPLSKNKKLSYIVTARKTFSELLMAGASGIIQENSTVVGYGFHDINAKVTYKPNANNSLSFNVYQGDDYISFWMKKEENHPYEKNFAQTIWGNTLVSGRWNHTFSSRLFAENTLSYTRYRLRDMTRYSNVENGTKYSILNKNQSTVEDASWRSAWKFLPLTWWKMEVGSQFSYLAFEPNYTYYSEATKQADRHIYRSLEMALYWENKINLGPKVLFQPSVRLVDYVNSGTHFFQPEPRVSLQYNPTQNQSFNLGYMIVSQSSHLLFTKGVILNEEVWFPALQKAPPQVSQQISGGWVGYFHNRMFSVQLDGYYKEMKNQVALKDGYTKLADVANVADKIETNGIGTAYGAELTIKKEKGLWTGFASYTWSESTRQFSTINQGKPYQFEYNRPHSISLCVNRKIGSHWNVNALWVFSTGLPFTPAIGRIYTPSFNQIDENNLPVMEEALVYGAKNSARMPVYHRLDIGATYDYQTKQGRRAQWSFSVYNLYSRQNAYDCFYATKNPNRYDFPLTDRTLKLYQTSFFPIIPTFSWKLYFDYKTKDQKIIEKQEKEQKKQQKASRKKHNWLYFE
ncbi:MAG TPA: carboxypeptidase-like regulatory domain-containing protein [Paludibacteraceae bacterium]|nr:carboxypeptidase-like regulatory domain-containing protein [Paludibacteraceae bacterium]